MIRTLLVLSLFFSSAASAVCRGRIDVAPAFLEVEFLEGGRGVRKLHLGGFRAQFDYFLYKTLLLRAVALNCEGDAHLETYTAGLGVCLPYKQFYFTPMAGVTYTNYRSEIDVAPLFYDLKEKFHSVGPFVSLDMQWCFHPKWRVSFTYQYSWSETRTRVDPVFKSKTHTKGPNYSLQLEHDITEKWSLNIGAAISRSLTRDKQGLRGKGIKAGVTYWF